MLFYNNKYRGSVAEIIDYANGEGVEFTDVLVKIHSGYLDEWPIRTDKLGTDICYFDLVCPD